jgi:hypothetical protein
LPITIPKKKKKKKKIPNKCSSKKEEKTRKITSTITKHPKLKLETSGKKQKRKEIHKDYTWFVRGLKGTKRRET